MDDLAPSPLDSVNNDLARSPNREIDIAHVTYWHDRVHIGQMEVDSKKAKTLFHPLLERVAAGEVITISNAGVPVARLIPIQRSMTKRQLGIDKGKIWMADDFDSPSTDIEASFASSNEPARKRRKRN